MIGVGNLELVYRQTRMVAIMVKCRMSMMGVHNLKLVFQPTWMIAIMVKCRMKMIGSPTLDALYDFIASTDVELNLTVGEEVKIEYEVEGWFHVHVSEITSECPPIINRIGDHMTVNIADDNRQHHLDEKKKNPNYNATYNLYGFAWAFKIWILESYPNSKQWWSKKDNVIPRCLAWTNITKFDKSHYNRLFGPDSIPIVNLDPTPAEKIQAWFDSSIPFFNGIVDEDGKGCGDDSVLVSKDNSVDEDCNVCEDASAGLSKDEIVNDKLVDEDCNVCEDASAGLSKDNVSKG
ncbi:phospholipase-like protein [Tanacetum coccineum]